MRSRRSWPAVDASAAYWSPVIVRLDPASFPVTHPPRPTAVPLTVSPPVVVSSGRHDPAGHPVRRREPGADRGRALRVGPTRELCGTEAAVAARGQVVLELLVGLAGDAEVLAELVPGDRDPVADRRAGHGQALGRTRQPDLLPAARHGGRAVGRNVLGARHGERGTGLVAGDPHTLADPQPGHLLPAVGGRRDDLGRVRDRALGLRPAERLVAVPARLGAPGAGLFAARTRLGLDAFRAPAPGPGSAATGRPTAPVNACLPMDRRRRRSTDALRPRWASATVPAGVA